MRVQSRPSYFLADRRVVFSPFERFVAFRYLKGAQGRAEGRGFLRFVMFVAVGGVAVGVAALLMALAIVRGFSGEIQEKIIGFGAHVQVESFRDDPLEQADAKLKQLRGMEQVKNVTPVVQEFALLRSSAQNIDGVAVWGVPRLPAYLQEHLTAGQFRAPDSLDGRGLVLGKQLADQLGVEIGDRVTVFSMRQQTSDGTEGLRRPRVKQLYVTGLYETLLADFDAVNAFTDLETTRALFEYSSDQVSRFDLTLTRFELADEVAQRVEEQLRFPVMARTIRQVYPGLFAWVDLQESIIPLVISVIVVVAAFNIVGTLLMIILEKTSDIGVLASMGASGKMLRRLFLRLGLLIGAVGTFIGASLALVLGLLQDRYELIPLPAEAYYVSAAPVELHIIDFVVVAAAALVLCALAAYLPARYAARVDPIRVIRFR